jgi:hypothetical protein
VIALKLAGTRGLRSGYNYQFPWVLPHLPVEFQVPNLIPQSAVLVTPIAITSKFLLVLAITAVVTNPTENNALVTPLKIRLGNLFANEEFV